ncbi:DUF3299 domain-containing protein [Vibrio sp. RC27]
MTNPRRWFTILLMLVIPLCQAQAEPEKLDWIDLVPVEERNQFNDQGLALLTDHEGNSPAEQTTVGKVRPELDGTLIKIPGFVVPLEGDENTVTEFLLVPYFGACIHVPPPPPNQIVYVKFPDGAPVQELWDVIYVVGTLKSEAFDSEFGQAGYILEGKSIEEYDDM